MSYKILWTKEKINEAFQKFINENGYMPTAREIDELPYLPSSRQLQRKFGGLPKIRENLGYKDIHLGKGVYRSKIANAVGKRGRLNELKLEKILKDIFGEPFVHAEKRYGISGMRLDFYVYCPTGNFGVDIFETHRKGDLHGNLHQNL